VTVHTRLDLSDCLCYYRSEMILCLLAQKYFDKVVQGWTCSIADEAQRQCGIPADAPISIS